MLGELGHLVVDVGHAYAHGGRARPGGVAAVHRHHHKLVQVVGSLEVQRARGEDGAVRGDGEVRAQRVVGQLGVLLRVAIAGGHCGGRAEPGGLQFNEGSSTRESNLGPTSHTVVPVDNRDERVNP